MAKRLKAPYPYYGGKGRVSELIWSRLGDPDNFIEPFAGSAAVLLARPHAPRIETINDVNCFVANFWRAVAADPDQVARHADSPVSEVDLHARHLWMLLSDSGLAFQRKMKEDPNHYDVKIAGWWVWGQSCWIGAGWCTPGAPAHDKRPQLNTHNDQLGRGVHAMAGQPGEKRPLLSGRSERDTGHGVHGAVPKQQMPELSGDVGVSGRGVHRKSGNRPQLADAFSRGRGVNSNDAAGTCDQRRVWLTDWMRRLADRFRTVRTCCGDWARVCSSPSVTVRLGLTGIFLDPPYAHSIDRMHAWIDHLDGDGEAPIVTGSSSNRDKNLYANDKTDDIDRLVAEVYRYCRDRGGDKKMRIVLAGYAGEHDGLEDIGWSAVRWKGSGYSNRTQAGKDNAARETLWMSPHCLDPEVENRPLFRLLEART